MEIVCKRSQALHPSGPQESTRDTWAVILEFQNFYCAGPGGFLTTLYRGGMERHNPVSLGSIHIKLDFPK